MAVSFSGSYISLGNKVAAIGEILMNDIASGAVQIPGMGRIEAAIIAPGSATSMASFYSVRYNVNSAGSAVNGFIMVRSAAISTELQAFIIGTP